MSVAIHTLKLRNMIAALTNKNIFNILDKMIMEKKDNKIPLSIYCGFDPTADSLHVGNLIQIIALRHFQNAGLRPIILIGGATGMIGDPSGKLDERKLLSNDILKANCLKIKNNIKKLFNFDTIDSYKNQVKIVNNYDWYKNMTAISWLRETGRYFRVNSMISKESVKRRLHSDQGISFLEFSYQLFQAYDFMHLYQNENCIIQIGGSDQWGNIVSGCDFVNRYLKKEVYGITLPLMTNSNDEKYGKSAGNAIWLDSNKTTYYNFYQYFLRSRDDDVEQMLKTFTFYTIDEIHDIMLQHNKNPEKRYAQEKLAIYVTKMIHGKIGLDIARKISFILFGGSLKNISSNELLSIGLEAPKKIIGKEKIYNKSIVQVTIDTGFCDGKNSCKRLIKNGGLYLNNQRVLDEKYILRSSDLIDDKVFLLRSGKKNYLIVQIERN